MKKKFFSIMCIIAIIISNLPIRVHANISFSDLTKEHWAYHNIMNLTKKKIINGYEDGTYRPENTVTRGEFFKLIATTLTSEENIKKQFNYSEKDGYHWAARYYMYLNVNGILMTNPIDNNIDSNITRIEMAVILSNAADKVKMKKIVNLNSVIINDFKTIEDEYKAYVANAISFGLLKGHDDHTFRANTNMTRAEAAIVICRFLENM